MREGETGVWAGEAKIGSIGVHVSRGVTTHGFAVNVDGDLQPFEWVIRAASRTRGSRRSSRRPAATGRMGCFRKRVAHHVAQALGRRQRLVSARRLSAAALPEAVPV